MKKPVKNPPYTAKRAAVEACKATVPDTNIPAETIGKNKVVKIENTDKGVMVTCSNKQGKTFQVHVGGR